MDFTLESQVVGVPDKPPTVPTPEFKYLEVEVTRTEGMTLYLKVPYDFDRKKLSTELLAKACKETCNDYDWDDYGWEQTVEWQAVKEVPEKDATIYEVYEVNEVKTT
jgi:hypothetical protein